MPFIVFKQFSISLFFLSDSESLFCRDKINIIINVSAFINLIQIEYRMTYEYLQNILLNKIVQIQIYI